MAVNNKILAFAYLALAAFSLLMCSFEKHLGGGSALSLIVTLPWSLSMLIFGWVLIHDGARSLLVFLVPFAALNFFLLFKGPGWLKTRRSGDDKPVA